MKGYSAFLKAPELPLDCLVSYLGHSLGESYSSSEMQSVYSTAQADGAIKLCDEKYEYVLSKNKNTCIKVVSIFSNKTIGLVIECLPMAQETGVQSQVMSYQRLKKWYLIPACLTLSIIRCISRVKWSNPGKGVAPSPTC